MNSTKKILVIGSTGMLARAVVKELAASEFLEVFATSTKTIISSPFLEYDVSYSYLNILEGAGYDILKEFEWDYVVNCAGVIKPHIKDTPESVLNAFKINSLFPHELIERVSEKTRIIQITTDGVYSGASDKPYLEDARHDALDVYGKTKSFGEVRHDRFFNIRCSIIGQEQENFLSLVEWLKSQEGKKVKGFVNHYWNGVTVGAFARMVRGLILSGLPVPRPIHFIPDDTVDKYTLLGLIKNKLSLNVEIESAQDTNYSALNRSLGTYAPRIVDSLWRGAGWNRRPTIEEIIDETL